MLDGGNQLSKQSISRRVTPSSGVLSPILSSFRGYSYAPYGKTLGKGLGLGVLSDKPFIDIIDLACPHINDILDEMCQRKKEDMKALLHN